MNKTEQIVSISAQVDNFEQAKKLLVDLEVLNANYKVDVSLIISPQVNFEECYKQT